MPKEKKTNKLKHKEKKNKEKHKEKQNPNEISKFDVYLNNNYLF